LAAHLTPRSPDIVVYRRRYLMITRPSRNWIIVAAIGATVAAVAVGPSAVASEGRSGRPAFKEQLSGYEETPAISTPGGGQFRARIDAKNQEITWQLSWADLEAVVTQAHIHFAGPSEAGGISVFLCTNLGNAPVPTQACPTGAGTIAGTIRPVDVIGPTPQGIDPGQFDELVAAIRTGNTYVNVHSTKYPNGEIRAQLGHHH
jgi:hypothetical protein